MHDVDGRAGDLGHGDGAVYGFSLGARGTGEGMINGRGFAFRKRARHDDVDHAAVFGVHADEGAILGSAGKGLENGRIVYHEDVGIRHEELEAGDAFVDHFVHIFEAGGAEIGDDHVQAVIDARFAFGLFPPGIESVAHARAAGLNGEIDERGSASESGGARAGFEIVGGSCAAEGHIEVGMDVDAAGKHVKSASIDDSLAGQRSKVGADFGDAGAFETDVGLDGGGGPYNRAVLDKSGHQIHR